MMKHRQTQAVLPEAANAPLLTRAQLARRWQVSTETLKRREKVDLPFLKLGRGVRYRWETVERIEREAEVAA